MKKQTTIEDKMFTKIINFLDNAFQIGKNIITIVYVEKSEKRKSTVAYESKFLKKIFLTLNGSKSKDTK